MASALNAFYLLRESYREFSRDDAARLGAAIAFYTIFSLAPLLIIVIAVAGFFWGDDAVSNELFSQLRSLLGPEGATLIQQMVAEAGTSDKGLIASLLGFAVLIFGASRVFMQLQDALNSIWSAEPEEGGGKVPEIIKHRLLSFAMVLSLGFLLLVSLVAQAVLAAIIRTTEMAVGFPFGLARITQIAANLLMLTIVFGLLFKVLPDRKLAWRHVAVGALVTAMLFLFGQTLIGLYLGNTAAASTYGAAGSLVLVLLWVYYSAQILLFGAEFTEVYARRTERGQSASRDDMRKEAQRQKVTMATHRDKQSRKSRHRRGRGDAPTPLGYIKSLEARKKKRLRVKAYRAIRQPALHATAWLTYRPWATVGASIGAGALAGHFAMKRWSRRLAPQTKLRPEHFAVPVRVVDGSASAESESAAQTPPAGFVSRALAAGLAVALRSAAGLAAKNAAAGWVEKADHPNEPFESQMI